MGTVGQFAEGQPKRIVVVDDHETLRSVVVAFLEGHGFDVVGDTGDETAAVRIAVDLQPDAILLDWRFGGKLLGAKILVGLKHELPDVPVVVYTAYAPDAQRATVLGAAEVVSKSLQESEHLVAVLHRVTGTEASSAG